MTDDELDTFWNPDHLTRGLLQARGWAVLVSRDVHAWVHAAALLRFEDARRAGW